MSPGRATRKTMRFPVRTPVIFWWTDEHGKRQQAEGRSRDISEQGAFVFAPDCPPLGANVGLRIDVEALPDVDRTLPIEFEGKIIRVVQPDVEDASSGFAVLVLRRSS